MNSERKFGYKSSEKSDNPFDIENLIIRLKALLQPAKEKFRKAEREVQFLEGAVKKLEQQQRVGGNMSRREFMRFLGVLSAAVALPSTGLATNTETKATTDASDGVNTHNNVEDMLDSGNNKSLKDLVNKDKDAIIKRVESIKPGLKDLQNMIDSRSISLIEPGDPRNVTPTILKRSAREALPSQAENDSSGMTFFIDLGLGDAFNFRNNNTKRLKAIMILEKSANGASIIVPTNRIDISNVESNILRYTCLDPLTTQLGIRYFYEDPESEYNYLITTEKILDIDSPIQEFDQNGKNVRLKLNTGDIVKIHAKCISGDTDISLCPDGNTGQSCRISNLPMGFDDYIYYQYLGPSTNSVLKIWSSTGRSRAIVTYSIHEASQADFITGTYLPAVNTPIPKYVTFLPSVSWQPGGPDRMWSQDPSEEDK